MLGTPKEEIERALTVRVVAARKDVVQVKTKLSKAVYARDALAKVLAFQFWSNYVIDVCMYDTWFIMVYKANMEHVMYTLSTSMCMKQFTTKSVSNVSLSLQFYLSFITRRSMRGCLPMS